MRPRAMLRLTLVRHAKAQPARAGEEDWDRTLEARGEYDAHEMGQRLKARKLKPNRILSSPAVRALITATIMARELGLPAGKVQLEERLYLAAPKNLMKAVQELGDDAKHLMIFGHNPGITEFADGLSSDRSIDNLPTCAIYTLEFDIENWSELEWSSGVNEEFDYPKKG